MRNKVAILSLLIWGGAACGQEAKGVANSNAQANVQAESVRMAPEKAYQLWKEKSQQLAILDVRTPEEYRSGHIKGAMNLDYYANFAAEVQKLPKDKTYLVYCASGRRSSEAVALMRKLGYQAYNIGGFSSAKNAGFPTE